ncbi:MAG: YhdP family protein [Gammaproteobacteria bacterium]|nr:YhdP family protein [Gammaproteobacteria bacterium]
MRIFKTLLVVLVIAWGVLALAVRATTPLLADYRDAIAALAAERVGAPVAIGTLRARWYGLRPLLELRDVVIGTAPEIVEVARIEIDLALAELLHGPTLDALRLTVDGLQLTAVRESNGQVHLEGLGTGGAAGGDAPLLPSHLRLINTRLVWIDRWHGRAPLDLEDVDILIDRDGGRVSLRASLHAGAGRAELAAELTGLLSGTDWDGDAYLRVDNLDVARLLGDYLPADYGLRSTRVDLQAWTHWRDATPVHTQGHVALRDVKLAPPGGSPLDLKLLAANFSFDRRDDGLRLGLSDLNLATAAFRWPRSDLALAVTGDDGGTHIDLAAGYLRLEDVAAILQVRPPDSELATALAALQPAGEVRALRLQATLGDNAASWRTQARFDAISTRPWGRLPGVRNLSGRLHGSDSHSVVTVDSHDTTLRFSDLFRDPLQLPRIAGRVDVAHAGDGWAVRSDRLQADAAHIRTLTRLHLRQIPDEPLFVDLQTDFRDGDAAFAGRYYPTGIMGARLVRWLDRAIASGRVVSGSALIYGPFDDFAFGESRSGSFQVVFDTDDIVLDYQEGWPAITGLDARVKFHGNQVEIASRDGRIYDSQITAVDARIASLDPLSPIRIRGQLAGPLRNPLRVLGEPALRERFGEFAEILRGDGDSRLDLDFAVPLGSRGDYVLDGRLQFAGNRLSLPDWDFAIRDIDGTLGFTLDGLQAEGIRAVALDRPVSIDVRPLDDGTTRMRSRGRFRPGDIATRFEGLPTALLDGAADFVIDVDVPPRRAATGPTRLQVRSDLAGMRVDLPAPFGKSLAARRELAVSVPLSGRRVAGRVRYGDLVAARFSRDGQRVDVRLGGGQAELAATPGVRVRGRLDRADVTAWQAALDKLPAAAAGPTTPLDIDLQIAALAVDDLVVDELQLGLRRDATAWRGRLAAPRLAGTFTLPLQRGREPLVVDLERLTIDLPPDEDGPLSPPPDASSGPDPATLPGLDLRIADLQVGAAHLGRLELRAAPTPAGVDIDRLVIGEGRVQLDARGGWLRHDGGYRTQVAGSFAADDIGGLLADVGYSRQIDEAPARAEFTFGWPGNPLQMHRATLAGKLDFDVGKGRLVELDPGVTRVVGLLNLNALTRRLRLDFSDFYKKGYSFDSIRGSFVFADGTATTTDLGILGPTGRIDVRGETDLVAERFDQKVMVTPDFDATLPIAGTIAGGPVAGIAVLVAQTVMNKQVDDLNRFDYGVTGPWNAPDVVPLDTGGTLSRLLKPFRRDPTADADATPPADSAAPPTAVDGEAVTDTPADAQQPAPPEAPADSAPANTVRKSLRGIIKLFEKGEPHGLDLPGEAD